MKFFLMHKNRYVASMNINNETGRIMSVFDVRRPTRLPIGVKCRDGKVDKYALDAWWKCRCIPEHRLRIEDALKRLKVQSTLALAVRGNALSLTDKYWIKPAASDLKWSDVNFFDNPEFSYDVGEALRAPKWAYHKELDYRSPDITTNGNLLKFWKYENGKHYLIKGGSLPAYQQPFNEIIASAIMRRLGISHVGYDMYDDEKPFSRCECFITPETEFVSAWQIFNIMPKQPSVSIYKHLLDCCEKIGINNAVHDLEQMIVLDYIILNEDRHLNNFGFLRNPDTLEWIGMAPIFDSGTSLAYNRIMPVSFEDEFRCKPFKYTHERQIRLVSSFDWIDYPKLEGIEDEITEIFSVRQADRYINSERCNQIAFIVKRGIEYVMNYQHGAYPDYIGDDVTADVGQRYDT